MDRVERIPVKDAASFEGVNYRTFLRRLERSHIVLANDPADARRKLVPVSALSRSGYQAWVKAETILALQGINRHPQKTLCGEENPGQSITAGAGSAKVLQPLLPFFALTGQTETALLDAVPPGISKRYGPYIDLWRGILGDNRNGRYKQYVGSVYGGFLIRTRGDFDRATAKLHGIGVSTIYAKLAVWKAVNHDPEIPPESKEVEFWKRILPKNRPGRSSTAFFAQAENDWMGPKLRTLYDTQAKSSVPHAYRLLLAEIDGRQRAWGAGYCYQKPSFCQCRTFLKGVDAPTRTLAREGEKGFYQKCAPYLSCRPPDYSNLLWECDQRLHNVMVQDSGHRIGRIWTENFIDLTSDLWLGGAFAPLVSSDMVMRAAAESLAAHGVPYAVHFDQGKEARGNRFNGGFFKIPGSMLYRESAGMWKRLGVRVVPAIGGNPRSKRIERWHRIVDDFDRNFSREYYLWLVSQGRTPPMPIERYCVWTGGNTDERPAELLDPIVKQQRDWLDNKAENPCIPTVEQYMRAFWAWCQKWNAEARGKGRYRVGMTPQECYNAKRPQDGFRVLTEGEVDYYTAEHRQVKIAKGGQINLTFYGYKIEYVAPELFMRQGEVVEVIVSRRTYQRIQVIYAVPGGTDGCEARVKDLYDWVPEGEEAEAELRAAIRAENAAKRAVKAGLKAQCLLAESTDPVALLETQAALPAKETKQLFGQTPAPRHPETSSLEWMETRRRKIREPREPVTSEGTADAVLALLKEKP